MALLTDLGLEYYNTAHYSLALEAWKRAWPLGQAAKNAKGKALADRAGGELAYMCARLGRMAELDALLKSMAGRTFTGPATEKDCMRRPGGPLDYAKQPRSGVPVRPAGVATESGKSWTPKIPRLTKYSNLLRRSKVSRCHKWLNFPGRLA